MSRRRRRTQKPDENLESFAHSAELYAPYVESLERGERNPPMSTIYRLTAALQVPLADLLEVPPRDAQLGQLIYCPGCDLAEGAIVKAYRRDEPCPDCGLPAAIIQQVLAARKQAVGPHE
jgi:transcriptional regulator with XRE-family HTH domain